MSDDELLEVLRSAERARRQLEAFDAVLIADLETAALAMTVLRSLAAPRQARPARSTHRAG